MIRELSELGKSLREKKADNEFIHNAIQKEFISIELVITKDGTFHSFVPVNKMLTIAEAITAKKGKARLLLDKAEEVLCHGGKKSEKKHQLFLKKLNEYSNLPELEPIIRFYNDNKDNGVNKALQEFEVAFPEEKDRKGNIGFRLKNEGERIHEKTAVLKEIIRRYDLLQKEKLQNQSKKCSLCGQSTYPVEDIPHGMIKKVPDGQSSGCALVSYNENAYESYTLKGNENSSICTNCAKTYVEGLNWLLSSGNEIIERDKKGKEKTSFRYTNRKNFGTDTAMVYWTRNNMSLPEIDYLEAPNPEDVALLIESLTTGSEKESRYLEPDQFYSFTLSGSAARVVVRDWIETSLYDFKHSIAKWFRDIAIVKYDQDSGSLKMHYSRLYDLARCCQRINSDGSYDKDDVSLSRVAGYLWNAALKNTILPMSLLTKVIERARMDKNGVTAERAALIKIILNRQNKGGDFMISEKLNEENKPVAYVCGQVFAKLEAIQRAALGDLNAGIRERYFTYAMTLPSAAFGRLFDLNSKHYTKLKNEKPGLAITLDKELQELCRDIDINNLPVTFKLEEKGQFAIGYYHQKQEQYSANKS
jgi:CRISPR-associated protein Csd1